MRDDLIKLYNRAKREASFYYSGMYSDDFAAHYIILLLEGKAKHQLIKHAFYDFLDKEVMPMKRVKHALSEKIPDKCQLSPEDRSILFDLLKKTITPMEEKILWLYLIEGRDLQEVGEMFGVHNSRISQRVSEILGKVRKEKSRVRRK